MVDVHIVLAARSHCTSLCAITRRDGFLGGSSAGGNLLIVSHDPVPYVFSPSPYSTKSLGITVLGVKTRGHFWQMQLEGLKVRF